MYWFKMLLCWLSVSFLGGLANIWDQSFVCCLSALFVWGWYLMLFSVYQPGPECVGPVWMLVLSFQPGAIGITRLLTLTLTQNTAGYKLWVGMIDGLLAQTRMNAWDPEPWISTEREREQLFVTLDNGSPPLGHLNREVQVYRGVKLLNLSFCPHTIPENCSLEENLLEQ